MEERLPIDGRIIAEKTVCILLVKGENEESSPIYAYVAVRGDRLQEFMTAQNGGTFYPEDFGVVIEAGEGEPSDEVRSKMQSEYNFDEEKLVGIPDARTAFEIASNLPNLPPPSNGSK